MILCTLTSEQVEPRRWTIRAVATNDAGEDVAARSYDIAAAPSVPASRLMAYHDRMVDNAGDNLRLELGIPEGDWQAQRGAVPRHVGTAELEEMIEAAQDQA